MNGGIYDGIYGGYGVHLVTGIPGIGKVLLFGFTCIVSFVDGLQCS